MPSLFAFFADVAVATINIGGGTTVNPIESITDVDFGTVRTRLDCLPIDPTGGTGSERVGHKDGGPEAHVELLVGEQGTLSSLDDVSDGNVVEDDSRVRTGELCCKFTGDKLPVANEFSSPVRESEFDSFGRELPC